MTQHILFISGGEIVLVMMLALLFFGSKAIPDIAKTLGKGMREFKKATNEIKREINENTGDFKKDIDDIKSTVKSETQKISSDIDDVSSSMKDQATNFSSDISDELSFEDEYDYPDHDYSGSGATSNTEESGDNKPEDQEKTN